ncbi:MAG: ATP-dependent helicase, partial [Clostridia bacterium]|nr:ATP-dependent helicase [Clostridia bacterium]
CASGELTAKRLADRVLSLPPLSALSREAYRTLLVSMINDEYLELTEEGGIIIGLKGEKLINSFKFYAVFKDSEDFTVRCDSEEIGTITTPPPVGDRFALAGRVWEVREVDLSRRLVFVKSVDGKMEVSWPGEGGEIHTRLLEAMHRVLFGEAEYPFLGENARERLEVARRVAKNAKMDKRLTVFLGGQSFALFPWLGTRAFRTLKRLLKKNASELGISDIQSEGCCYITFKGKDGKDADYERRICDIIERDGLSPDELVFDGECPVFDKYDEYVPPELLREAYALDRLCPEEVVNRFLGEAL